MKRLRNWSDEYWRMIHTTEKKAGHTICGARKRNGSPCTMYPMHNKERCKMHGGKSTSAVTLKGKLNRDSARLKHGLRSKVFARWLGKEMAPAVQMVKEFIQGGGGRLLVEDVAAVAYALVHYTIKHKQDPSRVMAQFRGLAESLGWVAEKPSVMDEIGKLFLEVLKVERQDDSKESQRR